MKNYKYLLSVILFLIASAGATAQDYRLIPDSAYSYTYDTELSDYQFAGVTYNYYSGKYPDSVITVDKDRVVTSKSIYSYSGELLTEGFSFSLSSGQMVFNQHQVFMHDEAGRVIDQMVTRWYMGSWMNLNHFTYYYDDESRLLVFNREWWRNDAWLDYSADSLFYNEAGQLVERSARLKATDVYITRTLYEYDLYGHKIWQTRQDFINSAWVNVNRTNFLYNACGTQTGSITYRWVDNAWQNSSMTETFFHFEIRPGVKKLPVCFHGRTTYIQVKQLDKFLQRGACLGECAFIPHNAGQQDELSNSKTTPFTVYPNPAGDYVTIKISDPDWNFSGVQLLDFGGRLLQSEQTGQSNELTIDLAGLRRGNYILRVTGNEVYSTIITKN